MYFFAFYNEILYHIISLYYCTVRQNKKKSICPRNNNSNLAQWHQPFVDIFSFAIFVNTRIFCVEIDENRYSMLSCVLFPYKISVCLQKYQANWTRHLGAVELYLSCNFQLCRTVLKCWANFQKCSYYCNWFSRSRRLWWWHCPDWTIFFTRWSMLWFWC